MAWVPPAGVTPADRRNPNTAFEADLPAMLDWLSSRYSGGHVLGLIVTARDTGHTYRVDGKDANGNYRLTRLLTEEDVAALRVVTRDTPDGWVEIVGLSASPDPDPSLSGVETL